LKGKEHYDTHSQAVGVMLPYQPTGLVLLTDSFELFYWSFGRRNALRARISNSLELTTPARIAMV